MTLAEWCERMRTMLDSIIAYVKEYARRMGELIKQFVAELKSARVIDDDCKPIRNTRPAWASPYGPPPKRTRR